MSDSLRESLGDCMYVTPTVNVRTWRSPWAECIRSMQCPVIGQSVSARKNFELTMLVTIRGSQRTSSEKREDISSSSSATADASTSANELAIGSGLRLSIDSLWDRPRVSLRVLMWGPKRYARTNWQNARICWEFRLRTTSLTRNGSARIREVRDVRVKEQREGESQKDRMQFAAS